MSREAEIVALLKDDTTLMAILLGGVFTGEEIDPVANWRDDDTPTKNSFDADGFLLPCAVVRDRSAIAVVGISDLKEKVTGVNQATEIYFYEHRGHAAIDAAKDRAYLLLQGHAFSGAYPAEWILETPPVQDAGPLRGNSALRQDWLLRSVRGN